VFFRPLAAQAAATLVWYSNDGAKDVVQAARFLP
jgi:hypothetical protein